MKKTLQFLTLITFLGFQTLFAQPYYVFINGFYGTAYQMYDDGTHGDATAGDGIYSVERIVNLSTTGTRKWFIKNTTAGGNTGVVNHGYSWLYYPNANTDVTILFTYNTNTNSTDWQPTTDIPNSNEPLSGIISIMLDGVKKNGVMKDDGDINGSGDQTAGDGIYAYKRTDLTAGTHTWYAYHKYDPNAMWSPEGKVHKDYINTEATVTLTTDNQPVYFYVDVNNGTILSKLDNPLPVELTTFTAKVIDGKVNLNWKTATEVNNYGFEIERKYSGEKSKWKKIGFVKGAGNSNSPNNYLFSDKPETSGKYIYRLKQIDIDGTFTYSSLAEVEILAPERFELSQNYPNPFNPSTKITFSIPEESGIKLEIYDVLGRKIKSLLNKKLNPGSYSVEWDASGESSGIYFYILRAGKYVKTRKMMLIK